MPDDRFSPASLPRPLRIVAVVVAAVLLTTFFIYLGFPWDLLAARISSRIEQQTGMRFNYGPVTASPQLLGPGIAISDLRARTPGGDSWEFSRVVLRPAWSLDWLSGAPAVHVDGEAAFGRVSGVALVSGEPGFDGELSGLDLSTVLRGAATRLGLTGTADVDADLRFAAEGVQGPVSLAARDGVLSHPSLPVDVPYEQIDAELVLGGDHFLQVTSCDIASPMGTGSLDGHVGHARALANAPIEFDVEIVAAEDMRAVLRSQRVRVGQNGLIELTLRGSLARPVAR